MARKQKQLTRVKTHWSQKPLYVIATEGAVTEKIYFSSIFQRKNIRMPILETKSGNSSPDKVFKRLINYKRKYNASPDELWLVIDRDYWELETLKQIAKECKSKGYNLIISNPCFELWLLLHQDKPKQPLTVADCEKELKKMIPSYTKSQYSTENIKEALDLAIKHAKTPDDGKDIQSPPSTRVFKLVEKLVLETELPF